MSSYAQRKFHFKHELPDGNIFNGFINVEADTVDELYKKEDIKGEYFVKKTPIGWHGKFFLDDGKYADMRKCVREKTLRECDQFVIVVGVYRPEKDWGDPPRSMAEANERMQYTYPVHYDSLPLFSGRLEYAICSEETHEWQTKDTFDTPHA